MPLRALLVRPAIAIAYLVLLRGGRAGLRRRDLRVPLPDRRVDLRHEGVEPRGIVRLQASDRPGLELHPEVDDGLLRERVSETHLRGDHLLRHERVAETRRHPLEVLDRDRGAGLLAAAHHVLQLPDLLEEVGAVAALLALLGPAEELRVLESDLVVELLELEGRHGRPPPGILHERLARVERPALPEAGLRLVELLEDAEVLVVDREPADLVAAVDERLGDVRRQGGRAPEHLDARVVGVLGVRGEVELLEHRGPDPVDQLRLRERGVLPEDVDADRRHVAAAETLPIELLPLQMQELLLREVVVDDHGEVLEGADDLGAGHLTLIVRRDQLDLEPVGVLLAAPLHRDGAAVPTDQHGVVLADRRPLRDPGGHPLLEARQRQRVRGVRQLVFRAVDERVHHLRDRERVRERVPPVLAGLDLEAADVEPCGLLVLRLGEVVHRHDAHEGRLRHVERAARLGKLAVASLLPALVVLLVLGHVRISVTACDIGPIRDLAGNRYLLLTIRVLARCQEARTLTTGEVKVGDSDAGPTRRALRTHGPFLAPVVLSLGARDVSERFIDLDCQPAKVDDCCLAFLQHASDRVGCHFKVNQHTPCVRRESHSDVRR